MPLQSVLNEGCVEEYKKSTRKYFSYMESLIKPEMVCVRSALGVQLCEVRKNAEGLLLKLWKIARSEYSATVHLVLKLTLLATFTN